MNKVVLMIIPALICGIAFIGCGSDKAENDQNWTNNTAELYEHNKNKITITEGIWGTLVKTEGNCFPPVRPTCKQFPVKQEIVVYEYTTWDETIQTNTRLSFFDKVNTKLIATTTSDREGFFQLELKPGKYSIFVKEKQILWANSFDGFGGISPVTVETSKISEINLDMNYDASY